MKILGTGWAKTGTTSLADAMRILGFSHKTKDLQLTDYLHTAEDYKIFDIAAQHDSFDDWPWLLLYREFDERFPGSKFVLTVRSRESWLVSYRKQLDRAGQSVQLDAWRRKLYDLPFPDVTDAQLIDRYERHNADVRAYFSGRPDDLLVVDWAKGDGWQQLCTFLDRPIPSVAFPRSNAAPVARTAGASFRRISSRALRGFRQLAGSRAKPEPV